MNLKSYGDCRLMREPGGRNLTLSPAKREEAVQKQGEMPVLAQKAAEPAKAAEKPVEKPIEKPTEIPAEILKEEKMELPEMRIVGVLFKTYILVEVEDTLLMIDQHAAHERLQYEKYMARARSGAASQQLLTPIIVRLSAKEMAVLMENMDTLNDAGYTIEPFGENDIQVRAVPFVLGKAELRPLFLDMIQSLSRLKAATIDARRSEIMQMACKSAVKAGDKLSDSEIRALIADMIATGAPPTCPHGRPVVKTMTKRDLEKMFKRIQ